MADPAQAAPRMTVEEFLEWPGHPDDPPEMLYDLIDGIPYPKWGVWEHGRLVGMASPGADHGALVHSLSVMMGPQVRPPCRVYSNASVFRSERTESVLTPDLTLSCTERERGARVVPAPVVVIEVLSPSTQDYDLGRKGLACKDIESMQDIVLVYADTRRILHRRRTPDGWLEQDYIGGTITLGGVAVTLDVEALYAAAGL